MRRRRSRAALSTPEFISAGCSDVLPMLFLTDLNAELADVFRNKNFNLPAFNLNLTIVLKQLPSMFC